MHESILIAGGGLAGLMCALECKRNGFSPLVLESKEAVQGAAEGLKKWPQLWEKFNEQKWKLKETFHRHTGEMGLGPLNVDHGACIERSKVHALFMEALAQEGVEVRCSQRVVDYVENSTRAGVVLSSGETLHADFVIAADGIHSKSWKLVTGTEPRVYSSGQAIYRCAYPVEYAMKQPALREKWHATPEVDWLAILLGPTSHAIMCFTEETAIWLWMHKEDPETSSESWTAKLSTEKALANIEADGGWASDFRDMVASSPANSIVDWKLMWRDLQTNWVSPLGRVAQIGDAAHAFLPTSVNGATQALEDALSLPTCLRLAIDKQVPQPWLVGAQIHNKLRIDRVSRLQLYGVQRLNAYRDMDWEAARANPERVVGHPPEWQSAHNPTSYAETMFQSCLESVRDGSVFVNTNVEPGYVHKPWKIDAVVEKADRQMSTEGFRMGTSAVV